jgi:hypothetical protein
MQITNEVVYLVGPSISAEREHLLAYAFLRVYQVWKFAIPVLLVALVPEPELE